MSPAASEEIDRLIRAGKIGAAQSRLQRVTASRIPRPELARFAELARRAALPTLALRWLGPLVRPAPRRPAQATEPELIEYAASLVRLGAVTEALKVLAPIDDRQFPRAGFERAAAHIARWRYADAAPLLERYVEHPSTPVYERFVGRVNLAASYVYVKDYRRATPLLRDLLHETSVRRYELLLGNVLHIATMNFISQRKSRDAEAFLAQASQRLRETKPLEQFFIRKWTAVLALMRRPSGTMEREALRLVGEEAERLGHWETRRDCDRYEALFTGDERLLLRIYFGTPFDSFRQGLIAELGRPLSVPESYLWAPAGTATRILDVPEGRVLDNAPAGGTAAAAKPAGGADDSTLVDFRLPHRLLITLASDFYRPFRMAALFEALYPGEYFHPTAAPNRIHQSVRSLRKWLADHCPEIELLEAQGEYRLHFAAPCAIRVHRVPPEQAAPREQLLLQKLASLFGGNRFTSREAAERLGIAQRSALRLVTEGVDDGRIQKAGKRAAASYRFVK